MNDYQDNGYAEVKPIPVRPQSPSTVEGIQLTVPGSCHPTLRVSIKTLMEEGYTICVPMENRSINRSHVRKLAKSAKEDTNGKFGAAAIAIPYNDWLKGNRDCIGLLSGEKMNPSQCDPNKTIVITDGCHRSTAAICEDLDLDIVIVGGLGQEEIANAIRNYNIFNLDWNSKDHQRNNIANQVYNQNSIDGINACSELQYTWWMKEKPASTVLYLKKDAVSKSNTIKGVQLEYQSAFLDRAIAILKAWDYQFKDEKKMWTTDAFHLILSGCENRLALALRQYLGEYMACFVGTMSDNLKQELVSLMEAGDKSVYTNRFIEEFTKVAGMSLEEVREQYGRVSEGIEAQYQKRLRERKTEKSVTPYDVYVEHQHNSMFAQLSGNIKAVFESCNRSKGILAKIQENFKSKRGEISDIKAKKKQVKDFKLILKEIRPYSQALKKKYAEVKTANDFEELLIVNEELLKLKEKTIDLGKNLAKFIEDNPQLG